jgi:hypothetical protein
MTMSDTLEWVEHDACFHQADIAPEVSYRIFEVSTRGAWGIGYELWFWSRPKSKQKFMSWHPSLAEAKNYAQHQYDKERAV